VRVTVNALCFAALFFICFASAEPQTVYSLDLRAYGFNVEEGKWWIGDASALTFVSDRLLLVSITQRTWHGGANPMFTDSPSSRLLLVDLISRRVVSETSMPVEQQPNAVQFAGTGKVIIWNQQGIRTCTTGFECGEPLYVNELRLVSPKGTTAVAVHREKPGAWGKLEIIDLTTLRRSDDIPERLPDGSFEEIIPGDGSLLMSNLSQTVIKQRGEPDRNLRFNGKGTFDESRFLNPTTLAYFDWDNSCAVISTIAPHELYRRPVEKVWKAGILPTVDGTRFGLYEHGYTRWNSIVNFLDIDEGRPENFQRVRVFDTTSGSLITDLEWDPRPHNVKPSLSMDGHFLARVRGALLEVLAVP
jgi:hypothetical protein